MTFKSFDVSAKVKCFGGFLDWLFCNSNFKHCKSYKVDSFLNHFFVYSNFKELSLVVIWSFSLSVVGNSGVAALEGSKSIKIRQCIEILAIVDEWPLFRGAAIEEFHCTIILGVTKTVFCQKWKKLCGELFFMKYAR